MEVLGRQPCKREQDLGWKSFHPSSAHQLFDGMPSQPEMPKEDQKISEPVPINSTINKEEKWLDEALDRILEKFEQMEVKRRCDEKIDRILEKLDEIEANRSKFFEEMSASIKATTADINSASFSTAPISPTPMPAKCSMVCPNSGNKCAMASASHNIKLPTLTNAMGLLVRSNHFSGSATSTPTKCLADCFDNYTGMNHAILDEFCASTTAAATMEIVVSGDNASSIVGQKDNTNIIQAEVSFPLLLHVLNIIAPPRVAGKLDFVFCLKLETTDGCLMQCLKGDKQLLVGHPKRNPWPPPWLDGVVRGGEVWHIPWYMLDSFWTIAGLVPPWPPPTQVSYCASLIPDIAIPPIEMLLRVRHWVRGHLLLPWPPPHDNNIVLLIDAHTFVKLRRANMVEAREDMKLTVTKLYILDLSCATPVIGHFGNHGPFQLSVFKIWPQFMLWKIWFFEAKMKLLIVGHPKQFIKYTILVLVKVGLYDLNSNCSLFEAEKGGLMGSKHFSYVEKLEFLSDKLVLLILSPGDCKDILYIIMLSCRCQLPDNHFGPGIGFANSETSSILFSVGIAKVGWHEKILSERSISSTTMTTMMRNIQELNTRRKHMLTITDACYGSWSTRKWIDMAGKRLQWMLGGGEHAGNFSWHLCWTFQVNIKVKKLLQETSKNRSKLKNGGGLHENFGAVQKYQRNQGWRLKNFRSLLIIDLGTSRISRREDCQESNWLHMGRLSC